MTEHAVIVHDSVESNGRCLMHALREDAPVSNGFVHQFRSDRAIDAAGNGANNLTCSAADFVTFIGSNGTLLIGGARAGSFTNLNYLKRTDWDKYERVLE